MSVTPGHHQRELGERMARRDIGVFGRIEDLLTGLMEGTLERLFQVRIQPAHIARRLDKTMEEAAMVGVDGLMAPNHYTVSLDAETYDRISGATQSLQRDLERHLVETATRRRYRNLDPFVVELERDGARQSNSFNIQAEFRSGQGPARETGRDQDRVEHTIAMPVVAAPPDRPPALFEVANGDGQIRSVPLLAARMSIGRAADNDLVIPDGSVSRYHAAVRPTGEGYVVEDLGSTNGLLVNGKQARSTVLKDGDRVTVGTAELTFKQR